MLGQDTVNYQSFSEIRMIEMFFVCIFATFLVKSYAIRCDECLQSTSAKSFCFQSEYEGERCASVVNLSDCDPKYVEPNYPSSVTIIKNEDFRNFEMIDDRQNYIQFRPQKIDLKLRKGSPINFTFSYKPALNYPLELYYLMDLTYSMKNDLKTLVNLGEELGYSLQTVSKNFKIAFGSYVEKLAMPFAFTNKDNIDNPCNHTAQGACAKSYLFKHIQNFTNDLDYFVGEVERKSNTSANLDDLEAGLEALMQVVVCGRKIGWSEVSRKYVIVSTGSYMHTAGDGLLSGTVQRNDGLCLIDNDGNYPSKSRYDYPSLAEIHKRLKKHKVNVIFAVKEKVQAYYSAMRDVLSGSAFVGTLEKDSRNIIQLTKDGYENFFRRVKFSVESDRTLTSDLETIFFADCDGKGFFRTNECPNVHRDNVIQFIVQTELRDHLPDVKMETIYITEKNIQERISVNLEYFGKCKCKSIKSEKYCVHGDLRCDECSCHAGWTGIYCNDTCNPSLDPCRRVVNGVKETSCSRKGDCECGRCVCDFSYHGDYCEYKCPVYKGKICNDRGICSGPDTCQCTQGYFGHDCSCHNATCLVLDKLCNDHGTCACNKCICDKDYSGKTCDYYLGEDENRGFCGAFLNLTEDFLQHRNVNNLYYKKIRIRPIVVDDDINLDTDRICHKNVNNDSHACSISTRYDLEQRPILLYIQTICRKHALMSEASIKWSITALVLLAGVLGLILYKCYIVKLDSMEYARFERELNSQVTTTNPLYTSPITKYSVPANLAHMKKDS